MKLLPLTLPMLVSAAMASSATQSDWSGGPGTPGPVLTWDSDFSLDAGASWLETPGTVGIAPSIIEHPLLISIGANSIRSADIDGDGDMDVLWAASFEGIFWFENADGLGTTWIWHPVYESYFNDARSACSADVDGDGDLDVLGAAYNPGFLSWWENTNGLGTSWIEHTIDGSFPGACYVHSADINGDGNMDVLGAAATADDITWFENADGLGTTWIEHTVDAESDGACSVHSADLNGDGYTDVLGAATTADDITWWENANGLGTTWIEHIVDGDFDGARSVHSNDIDGDGDIDVLGGAYTAGVSWWENFDGLGTTWIEHTVDGDYYGVCSVSSNDIDGDGDIDVLGGAYTTGISWSENNNGLGTSWIEHVVDGSFQDARSVHSADINGDGNIDVLGASYTPSAVAWWDLVGYSASASLESSILYTGCDPDWGTLLWSSQTPPGTSVSFQVRASDDFTQMGAWSDTLTAPCSLHSLLADNASYVQYRAILETADPDTTPTLLDVTVTWDPLGTGGSGPSGTCLLPVAPNPSSSSPSIDFNLAEEEVTELSVYDLSGRLVREFGPAEYPAGAHTIQLQPLSPGIYFVRLRAGEFTATQRFAVVE